MNWFPTCLIKWVVVLAVLAHMLGCAAAPSGTTTRKITWDTTAKPLVILPVYNLSGKQAPVHAIRAAFRQELTALGIPLWSDDDLDQFISRNRIRHTGGVTRKMAQLLAHEGVGGVLVTALELYQDTPVPMVGITARLVGTGETPTIHWIDGVGSTGNDHPGLLNLGVITDVRFLLSRGMHQLAKSLAENGDVHNVMLPPGSIGKYASKFSFSDPGVNPQPGDKVVVAPFTNDSTRRHAGEILQLHMIHQLFTAGFTVIDPGEAREYMLQLRFIQNRTPTLPDTYQLLNLLSVDYLVSGIVYDYQDMEQGIGTVQVSFTVQANQRTDRKTVWSATMRNDGDEGVYFFDAGLVTTAAELATRMSRAAVYSFIGQGNAK